MPDARHHALPAVAERFLVSPRRGPPLSSDPCSPTVWPIPRSSPPLQHWHEVRASDHRRARDKVLLSPACCCERSDKRAGPQIQPLPPVPEPQLPAYAVPCGGARSDQLRRPHGSRRGQTDTTFPRPPPAV